MILMVGCPVGGNVLVSLDDISVWQDEGVAYPARMVGNAVNFGKPLPAGRLRRIGQSVTLGGTATVQITPYGDGDAYDAQAVSRTLDPVNGTTQVIEAEVAVDGQRFQYEVEVTDFDGPVALGEAEVAMIAKRLG